MSVTELRCAAGTPSPNSFPQPPVAVALPEPPRQPHARHGLVVPCNCRYKLSELSNIAEVIDVCAACVDGSDDTFVEVLVALVNLCAKASAAAAPVTAGRPAEQSLGGLV